MSGIRIEGNTSGNTAEVNSSNELKVTLGTTPANVGYVAIVSENDSGAEMAGVKTLRQPETSTDFRLRTGTDTLMLDETFNYAAQNSGVWQNTLTTMTLTYSGGYATLNAGSSVANAVGAMMKTYKTFPLYGGTTLYIEAVVLIVQTLQTNSVIEIGASLAATAAGAFADGVAFRYTAGVLEAVVNYNTVETSTAISSIPTIGAAHKYSITTNERSTDFWVDDALVATIETPAAVGRPFQTGAIPMMIRTYHTGVTSLAQQVKVASAFVSVADYNTSKPWADQTVGAGGTCLQGQAGHTQAQTANYVNSAAPASATLSNTAAGYTTLGGQWQFVAVAGAETDYALFAFQVPATTVAVSGKSLYITNIAIDSFNTVAAVATTATVLQWAIGVGSTAVSLATAEAAAAKAPRRTPLGIQSFPVGAAVGQNATSIIREFRAPLVANAGEFVHVILKMPIATATATEIFRGTCSIIGYYE